MSTRLVILGLLRERPLYGYEIKQIIEEHMGDWTSIAFGSIYFALGKLAQDGFIEKLATEQEGSRPSRSIYQITERGREEFQKLLRQVWSDIEHQYFALDIGLFFMDALPIEEVIEHLRARVTQLDTIIEHIRIHRAEQISHPEVPGLAGAIFDHSLVHIEAELAWTNDLLGKVEGGEFP